MTRQHHQAVNEGDQLLEQMHLCEKRLTNCSINQFSDLRFQLKQVKEKLRLLNRLNRMK